MNHEGPWWKESVVYQIYPQSFNDTDGDGIGDILGIVEKLDYLEELGIDVVWLCPVYESPHHDDGYDVSDYRTIREEYGDIDDWHRLLDGLHDRDMRLIMDFVPNHTSDEHAWFVNAGEDPNGDYSDFYIWRPGKPATAATDSPGPADRAPPNNWESAFGGSAWSYHETVGDYYLHLFNEHQPDLDWTTPEVREEIHEAMEWWLERGIDGFRLDVVNLISKPEGLPDGDPTRDWVGSDQFVDGPELGAYLDEMQQATFGNYDTMTVGEMPEVTPEAARRHTGPDGPLDMVFHFNHVTLDYDENDGWWTIREWSLTELKRVITRWQTALADGWNAVYLGNHDQPRIVSRFGDDEEFRRESATLLGTLLLTLRGTPFIYQGEELGMTNYPFDTLDEVADAQTLGHIEDGIESGRIDEFDDVRDIVRYRSRDNARTPMQWDDTDHAGFTDGDPWLPVNPNYTEINAAHEQASDDSVLAYYRRLIELRHETPALVYGDYELVRPEDESLFAYTRTTDDDRLLILLNVDDTPTAVEFDLDDATRLLGNYAVSEDQGTLRPYEARVYRTR